MSIDTEVINGIADRKGCTFPGERDYFLVLAMLIEQYESKFYGDPEEEPA